MAAAKTSTKLTLTDTLLAAESPSVVLVVAVSDETNTVVSVSDHIASSSQTNQGTIAVAQESFVRADVGVQSVSTDNIVAAAEKRAAKTSKRLSVDTIETLSARVAELEATVARLVGCYPICTPTPTPTRTVTPTPTKTITPSVTKSVTPTPTKIFEVSSTPAATPSVTVTPTITPSVTKTVTPTLTPTVSITKSITPTPTLTPAEIISAIFESPAQLIFALGNLGADMSPEEREEATKTIIAATIVGNIATTTIASAIGGIGYRRP